jgi:Arc/MetJ family transcription regulator
MRTTVTIDDDVLRAARQVADGTGESVGQVLSRLARAALAATEEDRTHRNGVKLLPVRAGASGATLEEVNRLRDELP